MVEKFGSDQQQLANSGGSVISQDNAVLVNGDSAGETALLFGPAALREIQAGVANGSFAIPPADSEATITTDNALPYWTFTDVNSAGAITAALVVDTGAASGYVLRFTVASGTTTGKSATLTRFVPVASSASRSFSFYAEATFESGTASTQSTATLSGQFYKSDLTTTTGSPITSDAYAFNALVGATGITAPDLYAVAPDLTTMTAPADAAFLKLTITIATVATQSAVRTVDLTEVRLAHGLPELLITDRDDPSTAPGIINASAGELNVQSGSGDYLLLRPDTLLIAATTVGITAGSGAATLQGGTTVELIAPNGVDVTTNGSTLGTVNATALSTTGDLSLNAGGSDVILRDTAVGGTNPRLLFRDASGTYYAGLKSGAANIVQVLNGTSATDYAYLYAERLYPMNGSTASRYLYDDGTNTATSSNLFVGNFPTTGAAANLRSSSTAGSQLLVSTSSRRWKENIEDVDAETLEAAKRLKARHFNSKHETDNGRRLLGMIAEEVEESGLHCAVEYDGEGLPLAIDWNAITAALLARLEDAERRIAELESR